MFSSADLVGTLATAAYLLTAQAVLNAIVYAGVNWLIFRGRTPGRKRIVVLDTCAGAAASGLGWTALSNLLLAPVTLAIGAAWTVWIAFVLPGILTGVVAAILTRRLARQSALPSRPESTASTDTRA